MKYILLSRKHPETKASIFYAREVSGTPVTLKQVCKRIVDLTSLSSADVKSCIDALQHVVIDEITRGNSVRLGDLGSFRPTISSASVSDAKQWNTTLIRGVRVRFTSSVTIKEALQGVSFERADVKAED